MTLNDISNDYTLNIFTDASIKKTGIEYIGCYGAVAVVGDSIWDLSTHVIDHTTNNNSEIKAIREGIYLAIKHGNGKVINIFSDSQISVFGIRDRIFNWKFNDGSYYGYGGAEISNQEIFSEIAQLILQYKIPIRFWHQAGHIIFTERSLKDALHVFRTSNNIRELIDMNLIRYITSYNNMIDNETRNYLKKAISQREKDIKVCTDPIHFEPQKFDKSTYRSLLSPKQVNM